MYLCLLSGGESTRMGSDKAMLRLPSGQTLLDHQLRLLTSIEEPVMLMSRHPAHGEVAASASRQVRWIREAPPWQGPLLALHRLMEVLPGEDLLLVAVDMPGLTLSGLKTLMDAPRHVHDPTQAHARVHIAGAAGRCHPMPGRYPALSRASIKRALDRGERSLLAWIRQEQFTVHPFPTEELINLNDRLDLAGLFCYSSSPTTNLTKTATPLDGPVQP